MKQFALLIGRLLYKIVNIKPICFIPKFWSYIYTGFVTSGINHIGYNSKVMSKTRIIGKEYIQILDDVTIGRYGMVSAFKQELFTPQIIISKGTVIGDFCHITSINKINVGSNVLFGKFVTVTDNSHGNSTEKDLSLNPIDRMLQSKGPVIIGNNVWIGDKVTILPNVSIGDSSVIGSNSVVVHDIPPFSIAVGNPAKVIKTIK